MSNNINGKSKIEEDYIFNDKYANVVGTFSSVDSNEGKENYAFTSNDLNIFVCKGTYAKTAIMKLGIIGFIESFLRVAIPALLTSFVAYKIVCFIL